MKQTKPPEAAESPPEQTAEAESFGTWLRRQREGRQIALREIADQSKISMRYLQALEADRFDVLPAAVFAKGFLRQYAGYVGLDPEEVVNFYLAARRAQDEEEEESEPLDLSRSAPAASTSGRTILWVTLGLLGALAILFYLAERREASPAPAPPPAASPPATATPPPPPSATADPAAADAAAADDPAPPAADPSAAPAPLTVVLDFTGECWVQARVDGESALSRTFVEGESVQLDGEESVRLTFGDGGAVRVEVNGRPLPLESTPGNVIRDLMIDLDVARQLEEPG